MLDNKFVHEFWKDQASGWSLTNRNPLVGWYDDHMADPNEKKYLFDAIPIKESDIALEYGCGPGRNMIKFKDLFARIDGADISKDILEKAPSNLEENKIPIPNLYLTNGHSLDIIKDNTYDVVFSIICMQHISCRDWRLDLYREFSRVLKPGGYFTFQMGYGPGHPISRDYFHNYGPEDEEGHFDVRVENEEDLFRDLEANGFDTIKFTITEPTHDQHPYWIWVNCRNSK